MPDTYPGSKYMKRTLSFVCFFVLSLSYVMAGSYTVKVGSSIKVNCTATAPMGGYITHAFFYYTDNSDVQYLGINYTSSDCQATMYGLEAKANIKIKVEYAYTYIGTYDGNRHVGSGSYYDYITVQGDGTVKPTSIAIDQSDPKMSVGSTITLKVVPTPSNATSTYSWGPVVTLGAPYNFDIVPSSNGSTCKITAKKAGKLYLIAESANGKMGSCVVTAEAKDPTKVTFGKSNVTLAVGYSYKQIPTLQPDDAYTTFTYTSSNESVATVSKSSGQVTAVSPGTATITATSSNKLTATYTVKIVEAPVISKTAITDKVSLLKKAIEKANTHILNNK